MNRHFRRLSQFGKRFAARRSHGELRNSERELCDARTPQDVTSVRAKSDRHKKSTADKWNQ